MILYIDTSERDKISIMVKKGEVIVCKKKFLAKFRQAEKLLVEIDKMLSLAGIKLKNIKEIKVENQGSGFTALRIGVITANALGFALGIPVSAIKGESKKNNFGFSLIEPEYDREPTITLAKVKN